MEAQLVNTARISTVGSKRHKSQVDRAEAMRKLNEQREKDSELVTGIFHNLEARETGAQLAGVVKFGFKKYKGDPFDIYEFADGFEYTIPRGVADHLNEGCYTHQYEHIQGMGAIQTGAQTHKSMAPQVRVRKKKHRFLFQEIGTVYNRKPEVLQATYTIGIPDLG